MTNARGYRDLIVYQKAFKLAMTVFQTSKKFSAEEKYALTDQIRRSSRSVCTCIAEGYHKRIYPKVFVSKMADADQENSETIVWLEFATACKYISNEEMTLLESNCAEVGRMLNSMISSPEKFQPKGKNSKPE